MAACRVPHAARGCLSAAGRSGYGDPGPASVGSVRGGTSRAVTESVFPAVLAGAAFAAWGAACHRLARVWPLHAAPSRRSWFAGASLAAAAAAAAAVLVWRSELPTWATLAYLAFLAVLVLLAATDLAHRLLPHAALDPLIVGSVAFVPFNPAVSWQSALAGAAASVLFLGVVGLLVRGGIALGDLYLAAPLGLLLGLPGSFTALLIAALLAGASSVALLLTGRAGMKTYIPFGPFLVLGAMVALLTGPELVREAAAQLIPLL